MLPAILTIPQLGLTQLLSSGDRNLLVIQYSYNYHPMFILVRLAQILSGLFTILVVYWILAREYDQPKAVLGAAVMAFFPVSIKYFPNLHYDAILAPFALLALYWFTKQQYVRAGIFFGLALASKNAAIFLAPALLGYVIWEGLDGTERSSTLPVSSVASGYEGMGDGDARRSCRPGAVCEPHLLRERNSDPDHASSIRSARGGCRTIVRQPRR